MNSVQSSIWILTIWYTTQSESNFEKEAPATGCSFPLCRHESSINLFISLLKVSEPNYSINIEFLSLLFSSSCFFSSHVSTATDVFSGAWAQRSDHILQTQSHLCIHMHMCHDSSWWKIRLNAIEWAICAPEQKRGDIVIQQVELWLKCNYQPHSHKLNPAWHFLSALNQQNGRSLTQICRSLRKIIFLLRQPL